MIPPRVAGLQKIPVLRRITKTHELCGLYARILPVWQCYLPVMAQVSDRDIEMALRSLARIIKRYGPAYWPLFDRLDREQRERRLRDERLEQLTVGEMVSLTEFLRQKDERF